jgi:hypothetical protein
MPKKSKSVINRETSLIRRFLENNVERNLSHEDIIGELNISRATYYRHVKRIMDQDAKVWDEVYLDSAKYRAAQLMDCFNNCIKVCKEILADPKTKADDRMEAARTICEAQANILKLVSDGPTFRPSLRLSYLYPNQNQESINNNNYSTPTS